MKELFSFRKRTILLPVLFVIGSGLLALFYIQKPVTPKTLTIELPDDVMAAPRRDLLLQKKDNRYCSSVTNRCGDIQSQTETEFTIIWDNKETESFKKETHGIYLSTKPKSHPLLPERPTIRIQLNAEVKDLRQDEQGLCFDSDGNYLGTVISQSTTDAPSKTTSQKALYFETATGNKQMFIQNQNGVYQSQKMPDKKFKILTFIYSYKRPLFLSGQILRFFNQSYQNFDMRVSIKGFGAEEAASTFMREWRPFIEQKRLRITFDSNKDQFSNLMDALEGVDLTQYDYFCKIDDDDWYAPDYLETLVRHLNTDTNILSSISNGHYRLFNTPQNAQFRYKAQGVLGATLCFNRTIANELFSLQKMTPQEQIQKLGVTTEKMTDFKVKNEDVLIETLAQKSGKIQKRNTPIPLFINGAQYPSITNPNGK